MLGILKSLTFTKKMSRNTFNEISYEEGLRRAKEYGLEIEYQSCIDTGMTPQEACFEWDI